MQTIRFYLKKLGRNSLRLKNDDEGQYLAFTALAMLALLMLVISIFNVGVVIGDKMNVQNTADAAAYSQAVWEARTLNLLAYTNRAIISHMVTIAFATAILSQELLWKEIYYASIAAMPLAGTGIGAVIVGAINRIAQAMWAFWKSIAPAVPGIRNAARVWIMACQTFQDGIMLEYAAGGLIASPTVPERIRNGIDTKISINDPDILLGGAAIDAANAYALYNNLWFSPMANTGFDQVYRNSMDGFSRGSSFPRRISIGSPWMQFEFGIRGEVNIHQSGITQKDGFYMRAGYTPLGWLFDVHVPVAPAHHNYPSLGQLQMWTVKRDDAAPFVLAYARKKGQDVLQVDLLGIGFPEDRDIQAFSNAEVFYSDPDRSRGENTGANLFNPFWHARLAPVNNVLDFLPEGLSGFVEYLPITH